MYVGRFAPSPSGALHFGSLCTALGSFLRAKSQGGKFLIRIEDLDTYRCNSTYTQQILHELNALQINSDGPILYQSQRNAIYQKQLNYLIAKGYTYNCQCTRQELKQRPCPCRSLNLQGDNLNICFKAELFLEPAFTDLKQGTVQLKDQYNHIVLKRKDGLFAYNLAVVCDDIASNVTEIVRGLDLLSLTFIHKALYKAFNQPAPNYVHLPLALNENLQKYSKQNHAKAIMQSFSISQALILALKFLGQETKYYQESDDPQTIINKAILHFNFDTINKDSYQFIY